VYKLIKLSENSLDTNIMLLHRLLVESVKRKVNKLAAPISYISDDSFKKVSETNLGVVCFRK